MSEQATGGEQGQQGGEMNGIGAVASQAYGGALEGGASPQEAFEAAGAAAQEVATEMGVPQADFDQGMEAASVGFADAMASGASPGEAFGSAMEAAQESTDPGTDMGPPPYVAPTGDMTDVSGDTTGVTGDVSTVNGDVSGVSGDVSTLYGDVSGVTGDVTGVAGDVSGVIGDMSGVTGDMTGCDGDMSGVTGDMTGCEGDISSVTGDMTGCVGDMTGVTGDMTGCVGDMTGVEGQPPAEMMVEGYQGMGAMDQAFSDDGTDKGTSPPTDDPMGASIDQAAAQDAASSMPEAGQGAPDMMADVGPQDDGVPKQEEDDQSGVGCRLIPAKIISDALFLLLILKGAKAYFELFLKIIIFLNYF